MEKTQTNRGNIDNLYQCNKCLDSHWIIKNNRAYKCRCYISRIKEQVVGRRFMTCSFKNFAPLNNLQKEGYEKIKNDIASSYIFLGRYRTGKTHFLSAQYNDLLDLGYTDLVFLSEQQLFRELQNVFKDKDFIPTIDSSKINELTSLHLFLDDVGTIKTTEYICQEMFSILDIIYRKQFRLSISSSLNLPELAQYFNVLGNGGAIGRRIDDICQTIDLSAR